MCGPMKSSRVPLLFGLLTVSAIAHEEGHDVELFNGKDLTGWVVPALWIVAIGSTVTVMQRFAKAYQEMSLLDARDQRVTGEKTGS